MSPTQSHYWSRAFFYIHHVRAYLDMGLNHEEVETHAKAHLAYANVGSVLQDFGIPLHMSLGHTPSSPPERTHD